MKRFFWFLYTVIFLTVCAFALTACGGKNVLPPPEPIIKTVEVKVAVPVPCPALAKLGPEPAYPDTDAALNAAPDIWVATKLITAGRLMRLKRLAEYGAARASCTF
jgi:hypothetical protein